MDDSRAETGILTLRLYIEIGIFLIVEASMWTLIGDQPRWLLSLTVVVGTLALAASRLEEWLSRGAGNSWAKSVRVFYLSTAGLFFCIVAYAAWSVHQAERSFTGLHPSDITSGPPSPSPAPTPAQQSADRATESRDKSECSFSGSLAQGHLFSRVAPDESRGGLYVGYVMWNEGLRPIEPTGPFGQTKLPYDLIVKRACVSHPGEIHIRGTLFGDLPLSKTDDCTNFPCPDGFRLDAGTVVKCECRASGNCNTMDCGITGYSQDR